MNIPDLLPIKLMPELYTSLIGRSNDRQFMIIETPDVSTPKGGERRYIARYEFTLDGGFLSLTTLPFPCSVDESIWQDAKSSLLSELEPYTLCDIKVRPFQTFVDGIVFGLVYSEEFGCINLDPGALISFTPPWNGEYYT